MNTSSFCVRHRNGWGTGTGPAPTHCSKCGAALPVKPSTGGAGYGNGAGERVSESMYRILTGTEPPALKAGESLEQSPAICYECCATDDKTFMRAEGKITLYFVEPRHGGPCSPPRITNWPDTLRFEVFNITRSDGYGFGRRYPIVTGRFRFEGQLWSFRNAGDNQIARCKRLKDPR